MAVIKILSRHSPSYASLIRYILREAKGAGDLVFKHNLRSEDMEGLAKEFLVNESLRQRSRSDQVYLTHEILSFHVEDRDSISPELLKDMAGEYIRQRGEKGMFLGAVHYDTEHIHIHFCVSALEYRTGKSFHVAKPALAKLKVGLQEYHKSKYPQELSHSFCEHGKGQPYLTDRAWQAQNRAKRDLLKEEITGKVKMCIGKARSQQEFWELLREENLHCYKRKGVIVGIVRGDMKFRFSRIGIASWQYESLPVDLGEDKKALTEIQAIRNRRKEKDRLADIDMEPEF